MLFFDEIGMAEQSLSNPLKVLHKLFDDFAVSTKGKHPRTLTTATRHTNHVASTISDSISFVSIANWRLDLSKMSRCLYVTRSDPAAEVLQKTAREILDYSIKVRIRGLASTSFTADSELMNKIHEEADRLGSVYFEFRKGTYKSFDVGHRGITSNPQSDYFKTFIKQMFDHRHFFCLRDFYHLCKHVGRRVLLLTSDDQELTCRMVCSCIDTNFSGNVARLEYQHYTEHKPSSVMFKEKYLEQYKRDKRHREDFGRFVSHEFFKEHALVYASIENSLRRRDNRFLMVFVENQLSRRLVKQRLTATFKQLFPDKQVETLRGSQFTSDNLSSRYTKTLIESLKHHVMAGNQVFMEDMDDSYATLYDLFNQNFELSNNQKFCNVTYEDKIDSFPIHDNFRCVVVKFKREMVQSQNKGKNLEMLLPSPLLNRLEKHIVDFSDVGYGRLSDTIREVTSFLDQMVTGEAYKLGRDRRMEFRWKLNDLIFCYNSGELVQTLASELVNKGYDKQKMVRIVKKKLVGFYSLAMLVVHSVHCRQDEVEVDRLKRHYRRTHKINSFRQILSTLRDDALNKLVVFTMSDYMQLRLGDEFRG